MQLDLAMKKELRKIALRDAVELRNRRAKIRARTLQLPARPSAFRRALPSMGRSPWGLPRRQTRVLTWPVTREAARRLGVA